MTKGATPDLSVPPPSESHFNNCLYILDFILYRSTGYISWCMFFFSWLFFFFWGHLYQKKRKHSSVYNACAAYVKSAGVRISAFPFLQFCWLWACFESHFLELMSSEATYREGLSCRHWFDCSGLTLWVKVDGSERRTSSFVTSR